MPPSIVIRRALSFCCALLASAPALTASAATSDRQALTTSHLKVCADPANLPFSNEALEGLENRVIELVADELQREVRYTWYPQATGFVRNTLRLRACDLVSGITTSSEKVQNTNPYYHSAYALVMRAAELDGATRIADLAGTDGAIGVVAGTPPADVLATLGLLDRVRPYHLVTDTRVERPAVQAVADVASGQTRAALIWGPIAGWYAYTHPAAGLAVVPLLEETVRMNYRVSMAVRYNETDWKRTVNAALEARRGDIASVLHEFGIPLLDDRGELLAPP